MLEQLRRAAFVPTLIDVVEDADWIALITVGAPGRLPTARDASGIDRMLALIPRIQAISTEQFPSTVDTAFAHLQISPWADMSAEDPAPDPWVRRNLERLLELERQASSLDPEVVCHGDFRLDNVLFTANGRTMLVDWAQASTGPVFADLVEACIDIEVAGGARASTTFSSHAPIAIADSDDAVNAHLAGVAGRLTRMSGFPEPPGTTHVRAFQRQQAACARAWLSERLA